MGQGAGNLIVHPCQVFLVKAHQQHEKQGSADCIDQRPELFAVDEEVVCREKENVHPDHFYDFKSPLRQIDCINAGKQNRNKIKSVKPCSAGRKGDFALGVGQHAQKDDGRGDVDRGECESARCPCPVRDRINMNRQHAGCEENHHAEKYQAEYRVHPRQNDSQRNDSEENDEKYQ